jgi:hypothetical protein
MSEHPTTFSSRALVLVGPIAAALFPAVSLYSANPGTPFVRAVPSLVILAALALGVAGIFRVYARSATRGALAAIVFFAVLFAFGPITSMHLTDDPERDASRRLAISLVYLGLVVAWAALLLFARRARGAWDAAAKIAAVVACSSLAVACIQIVWRAAVIRSGSVAMAKAPEAGAGGAVGAAGRRPDIYHILLDGYSRADVLRELYGQDNSEFLAALEQRGFYVAPEARSNYNQTALSLSSMLSLEYLPDSPPIPADIYRQQLSETRIRRCRVVDFLRARGYRFVNIASLDDATSRNNQADVELASSDALDLGGFELQLLLETPFRQLARGSYTLFRSTARNRILSQFHSLAEAPDAVRPAPAYVFDHIVCPHPPFVFAADGSDSGIDAPPTLDDGAGGTTTAETYRAGYREQTRFVNAKVIEAVDAILARYPAGERPVIIISSDHGGALDYELRRPAASPEWARWGRTGILQAVLAPDEVKRTLYPAMTPVNTYRVLFDGLFDARLGLLPDRSYRATWDEPYRPEEVGPAELLAPQSAQR